MIVLNENEWAEEMIKAQSLGDNPFETICRVARYYIDEGYDTGRTKSKVEIFLQQCDPNISIPKWDATIDMAIKRASKRPAVNIDSIPVFKEELDVINSIDGKPIKRLAFTLLCLAKYWSIVNDNNTNWVNTSDIDIKKMANIRTSISRESDMYRRLRELGLIAFSKKVNNLNVRVLFCGGTEEVMSITDFRNLGNQYLMYCGEPYYKCQNCGIVTKLKYTGGGSRPKYCSECAYKLKIQLTVNSVMRRRRPSVQIVQNQYNV